MDLSVELAAILEALHLDRITLTAADLAKARSRAIYIAPGPNGSKIVESRVREFRAEQGTLFSA